MSLAADSVKQHPLPYFAIAKSEPMSRRWNFAFLVLGFAIGQGSLFAAQTALVASDKLAFLGLFGLNFGFAVLGLQLLDWGGTVTLARRYVAFRTRHDDPHHVSGYFFALVLVRLIIAILICAIALAFHFLAQDSFSASYMLALMPAYFFWTLNGAGLLDGAELSGLALSTVHIYLSF